MHSSLFVVFAALLVTATAQFLEEGNGCTTIQCRRNAFLMKEREELNDMQLEIMEMLMKIQTLNEQETYLMGLPGPAMHQPQQVL